MDKYCRLCWNTKNWRQPTGEARLLEHHESYVAKYGFGHEEWLFNNGWLLKGYDSKDTTAYRYGFLQPIGKYLATYQGKRFDALLYTVNPDTKVLIVAKIGNLYVPDNDELDWAFDALKRNGWLEQMRKELEDLQIDSSELHHSTPSDLMNVRFRPSDVTYYDPMLVVDRTHKIARAFRYMPYNWDDGFSGVLQEPEDLVPPIAPDYDEDPTRSEVQRTRSAIEKTVYDPRHIRLQNQLYRSLCASLGEKAVHYEMDFVDLAVITARETTYIEIKMELTVKRCIRLAIGQLLEYSHYPDVAKADRFLVVGEAIPAEDDEAYLDNLRKHYDLPLHYARWDWELEKLTQEI